MTKADLTLAGLTDDKTRLVLVNDAGDEFTVAADATLRAALRGETTRPGQLEISMESALRPRDIQARIRAGETPESVAAAAQTTLEKVMTFAGPVLAEREHVAGLAQKASVRRRVGDGPAAVLGEAVTERLRSRSIDPTSVAWDACRRDDGRWTLTATYSSGESTRQAEFVYDAAGRYVIAEDDESRWLVGERSASHGPQPRGGETPPGRRLASLTAVDDELPLGEDAIELVARGRAAENDAATADLTEPARALRSVPAGQPSPAADWIGTQAPERPPLVDNRVDEEAPDEAPGPEQPAVARKGRSRASVPSWDEIMFGAGRD